MRIEKTVGDTYEYKEGINILIMVLDIFGIAVFENRVKRIPVIALLSDKLGMLLVYLGTLLLKLLLQLCHCLSLEDLLPVAINGGAT